MQTTTWTPVPPQQQPQRPPTWPLAFGWYAVGFAGTAAAWSATGVTISILGRTVGWAVGYLMLIGGIVALVKSSGRLAPRYVVALVLGVITPFVLAVVLVAALLYALAHSNWTF